MLNKIKDDRKAEKIYKKIERPTNVSHTIIISVKLLQEEPGFRIRIRMDRINLSSWIRIRIQIAEPDPDPGGPK
jgi:hypothetical protein